MKKGKVTDLQVLEYSSVGLDIKNAGLMDGNHISHIDRNQTDRDISTLFIDECS